MSSVSLSPPSSGRLAGQNMTVMGFEPTPLKNENGARLKRPSAETVDTNAIGLPASFRFDLQDFEGFHVWRGFAPNPEEMLVVQEISKEDAHLGVDEDSLYFLDNPNYDVHGRKYYEWVDRGVFVGFTYYYAVTSYDRGYFFGFFEHNKLDNYICFIAAAYLQSMY